MTFTDIKDKLRKPTQFICAEISIQRCYYRTGVEVLLNDVKRWLKGIEEGNTKADQDGFYNGPFLIKKCRGTKEECKRKAQEERFHLHCCGSTSRVERTGMWRRTWMVLPADETGNWVPTKGMVEKALGLLQEDYL